MILSILRFFDKTEIPKDIICRDDDFKTALSIADSLLVKAAETFKSLPSRENTENRQSELFERISQLLPEKFTRQDYNKIVKDLAINTRSSERYLKNMEKNELIKKLDHGKYVKTVS